MAGDRDVGSQTAWLATIPLFEGMSEADLGRLVRLGSRVEVPPGEVLVDQGDPGTY